MASPRIIFPAPLTDGQRDCVDKLREALVEAERGNIHTVGMVLCMTKGYAHLIAGTAAAELNLGLDSLKRRLLDHLEKPVVKL
jgi:hypothetical protein